MSPGFLRQGFFVLPSLISHFASALAFISRSTSAYTLVARIKDQGLVIISGCGHPTIEIILQMVRHLSNEPLYAIAGGLHFPVTKGRFQRFGIQLQMFLGTGKPPWRKISDDDVSHAIADINEAGPKRVLPSANDTCDHALERLAGELHADTTVLEAGRTYRLP